MARAIAARAFFYAAMLECTESLAVVIPPLLVERRSKLQFGMRGDVVTKYQGARQGLWGLSQIGAECAWCGL